MVFTDADQAWTYKVDTEPDSTYAMARHTDALYKDFFQRPVQVAQLSWTPGSQLFADFNPWQSYFTTLSVRNKITNFKLLRCNLHVKVQISGNPFYYGRVLMSYNPYTFRDGVTRDRSFFRQDVIQASQRPHILIDPSSSQGGEMVLPFIYPYNWIDITRASWYNDMGEIIFHDLDVLRAANGSTDTVGIKVYAWAENLELSVPTVADAQSEYEKDGPISKPASAVARIAADLTKIPTVAPYMKATEMVASSIGNVARALGYSRPIVHTDPLYATPRYTGTLANTDLPETIQKLSVDSKNELTIDSRVVGLAGHDEMTILGIAQRWSYLTTFDWDDSDDNTRIWTMPINPTAMKDTLSVPGTTTEHHPTALAFAALPFQYWQGSIKFRFVIAASQYHRGRLKVVFDGTNSPGFENTQYQTIVDIAETQDFEYECKWIQDRTWLQTRDFSTVSLLNSSGIVAGFDNGCIRLVVANRLTSPSVDPAEVKVHVFVCAGDDFAVAAPRNIRSDVAETQVVSYFPAPFDVQSEWVSDVDHGNAPLASQALPSGGNVHVPQDNQYLVHMGERIVSFRQLLKRYNWHYVHMEDNELGLKVINLPNFPFYNGCAPGGLWDPDPPTSVPYNFSAMTLMNYLTPAYVCRRGGIRWKYVDLRNARGELTVIRNALESVYSTGTFPYDYTNPGRTNRTYYQASGTAVGAATILRRDQGTIEIELPFYTPARFVPAREINMLQTQQQQHSLLVQQTLTSELYTTINAYVAAGEDFSLSFFIGAPVYYVHLLPQIT